MKRFIAVIGILCAPLVWASDSDIPRTSWGDPDISGTYDVATLTPVQRPRQFGDNEYLTPEQANALAKDMENGLNATLNDLDANREAPPVGGDGSPGAAGNVGGYNTFWIANGETYNLTDGKFRTSITTYPTNGRRPPMHPEVQAEMAKYYRRWRPNDGTAFWAEPSWEGRGPYDNPEDLTLADRCLLGFSSTGGPPMMPALYNNIKTIVQGPETVTILIEMVHDARIVRIGGEHAPEELRFWLGDSIGHWDGDTLVIETTNFNDNPALGGASRNLRVEERLTPRPDGTLNYQFTVEDPTVWQDKWVGEYSWPKTEDKMYEYACHEGNYAMGNILRGARRLEREYYEANPEIAGNTSE